MAPYKMYKVIADVKSYRPRWFSLTRPIIGLPIRCSWWQVCVSSTFWILKRKFLVTKLIFKKWITLVLFFTMLFCVCVSYSLAVLAVRQIINKYFLLNIENGQKNSKFSKLMLFREKKVAKSNSGEHFWYQFVICIWKN